MSHDHAGGPTKEQLRDDVLMSLQFMTGPNWFSDFQARLNVEEAAVYEGKLVSAAEGISECMDERMCLTPEVFTAMGKGLAVAQREARVRDTMRLRNTEYPKPSFVGGAAGWVFQFILMGKQLPEAVAATKKLYEKNGWGDMEIHIDDGHGTIADMATLMDKTDGCGFLGVAPHVADILQKLHIVEGQVPPIDGNAIFTWLREAGAKTVPLTGNHRTDVANVVINTRERTTLNKDLLYGTHPAFVWDMWATTKPEVIDNFNQLAGTQLSQPDFVRLQAGMHLATGMMLQAVRMPALGKPSNLIITK